MDKGSLETLLAWGLSLEDIGRRFDRHPSTVAYWLKKYGLEAANRDKHLAKGAIPVTTLQPLVEAGLTIAEIADKVGRTKATVRHWLCRHGLETKAARRRHHQADAKTVGLETVRLVCRQHGESDHALCADGAYRCRRCRVESVSRRRRKVKQTLVGEAGGCCCVCGYDQYLGALEFHHLDPSDKRLTLSGDGVTLAIATFRAEAQKCILVCSNCHAEIEAGVTRLPDKVLIGADGTRADQDTEK